MAKRKITCGKITYTATPITEAIIPKEPYCRVYENRHWIVTEQDEILFYGKSPQCNAKKELAKATMDRQIVNGSLPNDCRVCFIPIVFQSIKPRDFA